MAEVIDAIEKRALEVEAEKQAFVTVYTAQVLRERGFYAEAARSIRLFYTELTAVGFTKKEALFIVASAKK